MNIQVRDGKQYAPIEELFRWSKNPKIVLREDFDRLKKQLTKFGQFKPLIVLASGEVIGGNSRLEALKELGIKEAWVSLVNPKTDAEKLEVALADNDEIGKYVEDELNALVTEFKDDLELGDYKINIGRSIDLEGLLNSLGPSDEPIIEDEGLKERELKNIKCPHCGEEFTI